MNEALNNWKNTDLRPFDSQIAPAVLSQNDNVEYCTYLNAVL